MTQYEQLAEIAPPRLKHHYLQMDRWIKESTHTKEPHPTLDKRLNALTELLELTPLDIVLTEQHLLAMKDWVRYRYLN